MTFRYCDAQSGRLKISPHLVSVEEDVWRDTEGEFTQLNTQSNLNEEEDIEDQISLLSPREGVVDDDLDVEEMDDEIEEEIINNNNPLFDVFGGGVLSTNVLKVASGNYYIYYYC